MTIEQGYAAARIAGLNLLSTVRNTLGSLDEVVRLVKVLGMVNCTPDFGQQPAVVTGFSELIVEIFGEIAGKGGRSAVGMASLPANMPVEIEAIFEVRGAMSKPLRVVFKTMLLLLVASPALAQEGVTRLRPLLPCGASVLRAP